jgi:hypothetical protein
VVGFCGYSGDGKSTVGQAFATGGRTLWSDDLLAFRAGDGGAVTTALPFAQHLREPSRRHFGAVERSAGSDVLIPVWSTAPLCALAVLEPRDEAGARGPSVSLARFDGADALDAILRHGLRLLPLDHGRERRILGAYLDLVGSLPVHRLTYSRTFDVLTPLVRLLERDFV